MSARDAVAYTYTNNTDPGYRSYIGRVVGWAGAPRIGVAYTYTNNLAQLAGSLRTLEDGTDRHLEDGTDRTLE